MNRLSILCAIVFFAFGSVHGQNLNNSTSRKEAAKAKKEIAAQKKETVAKNKLAEPLLAFVKRLKEGSMPQVVEEKPDGFKLVRNVASDITLVGPSPSDFDEKPYQAQINWVSETQNSKIYATREKAESSKEWLKPGRMAGVEDGKIGSDVFNTTFYYQDKKWKLDKMMHMEYENNGRRHGVFVDQKHPWWQVWEVVVANEKNAPPEKEGISSEIPKLESKPLDKIRKWVDIKGRAIEAEFVNHDGRTVTLRKHDGKEVKVTIQSLCRDDLEWLLRNDKKL